MMNVIKSSKAQVAEVMYSVCVALIVSPSAFSIIAGEPISSSRPREGSKPPIRRIELRARRDSERDENVEC